MLAAVAEEHADLPAVIDGDTTLTFPELRAESLRVAGGLQRLGVQPGDRVAVWVPNVWQWAATAYGIWELGAIIVPIGTRYRGHRSGVDAAPHRAASSWACATSGASIRSRCSSPRSGRRATGAGSMTSRASSTWWSSTATAHG